MTPVWDYCTDHPKIQKEYLNDRTKISVSEWRIRSVMGKLEWKEWKCIPGFME